MGNDSSQAYRRLFVATYRTGEQRIDCGDDKSAATIRFRLYSYRRTALKNRVLDTELMKAFDEVTLHVEGRFLIARRGVDSKAAQAILNSISAEFDAVPEPSKVAPAPAAPEPADNVQHAELTDFDVDAAMRRVNQKIAESSGAARPKNKYMESKD